MYRSKSKIIPMAALLCYITSILLLAPASVFCFDSDRHYGAEFELAGCFPSVKESESREQSLSGLCCVPESSQDAACNDVAVQGTTLKSNSRAPRINIHLSTDKFRPNWNRVVPIAPGQKILDPAHISLQASLILKQVRTVVLIQ